MPTVVTQDDFGTTSNGQKVTRYTLKNAHGMTVKILDLGGIITSIIVPDKHGKFEDITTGYDTLAEYEVNPPYFGAVIGRIANRIHGAKFTLDDVEYQLALNSDPNHIHGGLIGFDKRVWQCSVDSDERLVLTLVSPDGDEGFPGTLTVMVIYELTHDNELMISYSATVSDKPTIINLTNHAYFNLAGHGAGNISNHKIMISADTYLPKNDDGVPTGEILPVDGTPFDLRSSVPLVERIPQVFGAPGVNGFDHNFCLSSPATVAVATMRHAARLFERETGRILDVFTDQPGLQLYTGNHLDGLQGKDGASYTQHSCLALETQNYPDAIHHENFPSCVLHPNETYKHRCTYKFTVHA
jgi:aldose 1-epimerase